MLDHPAVRWFLGFHAVISDKKTWTNGHDIAKNCEPQKNKSSDTIYDYLCMFMSWKKHCNILCLAIQYCLVCVFFFFYHIEMDRNGMMIPNDEHFPETQRKRWSAGWADNGMRQSDNQIIKWRRLPHLRWKNINLSLDMLRSSLQED